MVKASPPRPAEATERTPRRTAPIAAVAARAGVSIATVSRIVNGVARKASPGTVERVRAAIAALDYRPMRAGRALRQNQSHLVALLASNLANPSMAAIAAAAEVALREAGYVMVACDTHDRPALQDEYLLEMRAHTARAIVLLGAVASPRLAEFRAHGPPLLFVNRRFPGERDGVYVGIDNRAAGREVAEYFLGRGVRALAVIHGDLASSATSERVQGFRQRLARERGALDGAHVVTEAGGEHLQIGHHAMGRLMALRPRVRGVFCASDLIAYGAARRARELGLDVPGDVELVGFDDNPLNDWVAPWLNSVRVPYDRYGAAIVAGLEQIWCGATPRSIILPHQLAIRITAMPTVPVTTPGPGA